MSSKIAFRNTLQLRNTDRKVFVPFLYSVAARVANMPLKEMVWNPTYYTHSLEACYELFKHDAIANCYDSTIEIESCGCEIDWHSDLEEPNLPETSAARMITPEDFIKSGRLPVLIEATKRLTITLGRETGIVPVVTGPCTFATTLQRHSEYYGSASTEKLTLLVGDLLKKFVKSLCELKVDAIFFREDTLGSYLLESIGQSNESFKDIYKTLLNIIRFYNCFCVVIVKEIEVGDLEMLCHLLRPNGVIILGKRFSEAELGIMKRLSNSLKVAFGLPLPIGTANENELYGQVDLIESFIRNFGVKGFFYTSDGEIPHDTPIEQISNLIRKVRS